MIRNVILLLFCACGVDFLSAVMMPDEARRIAVMPPSVPSTSMRPLTMPELVLLAQHGDIIEDKGMQCFTEEEWIEEEKRLQEERLKKFIVSLHIQLQRRQDPFIEALLKEDHATLEALLPSQELANVALAVLFAASLGNYHALRIMMTPYPGIAHRLLPRADGKGEWSVMEVLKKRAPEVAKDIDFFNQNICRPIDLAWWSEGPAVAARIIVDPSFQYGNHAKRTKLLRMVLAAGADVNEPHPIHGLTPMELAVASGHADFVEILKCAGAHLESASGHAIRFLPSPTQIPSGRTNPIEPVDALRISALCESPAAHAVWFTPEVCAYHEVLYHAIYRKDVDEAIRLMRAHPDVCRLVDFRGSTLLFAFCDCEEFSDEQTYRLVDTAIDLGADVNVRSAQHYHVLYYAIATKKLRTVERILAADPDIALGEHHMRSWDFIFSKNKTSPEVDTCMLRYVISHTRVPLKDIMIVVEHVPIPLLFVAIAIDKPWLVCGLLEALPTDYADTTRFRDASPLTYAYSYGVRHESIMNAVVARTTNPWTHTDGAGKTAVDRLMQYPIALFLAIFLGYPELVTRVLAKLPPHYCDEARLDGKRPLDYACRLDEWSEPIVKLILEKTSDPLARDSAGKTIVDHLKRSDKHTPVIGMVLDRARAIRDAGRRA